MAVYCLPLATTFDTSNKKIIYTGESTNNMKFEQNMLNELNTKGYLRNFQYT